MMNKRSLAVLSLALILLFACGGKAGSKTEVNLMVLSISEIEAKAKEEGHCESVAMPDNWANWEGSWKTIERRYGISHSDTDMTSVEEITLFEAEKESPTKDLGDLGFGHVVMATEQNLLKAYKPTTWDSIPDWAKDPEGCWIMSYIGTTAFIVNSEKTGGKIPESWEELMEGGYMVSPGNVIGGAGPQTMVIACALANGGSMENVQPGINYFRELAIQGRIDPANTTQDRFIVGETQVIVGKYDFMGLGYMEALEKSGGKGAVIIPSDGAVQTGYCLGINQYAPHPHAAALTVEYLLSDEGQIDRARGFARPIRSDVELPEDVKEKLLPDEAYEDVVVLEDAVSLAKACSQVSLLWEEEVIPYIH